MTINVCSSIRLGAEVCNITSDTVYLSAPGSCSFTNNDTCGYTLNSHWEVAYGETSFSPAPNRTVLILSHGAEDTGRKLTKLHFLKNGH